METKSVILKIISELKNNSALPKHIEKTVLENIFFFNVFDQPLGTFIFYNVATGVDTNEESALLKAMVEYLERQAHQKMNANNSGFFGYQSTDGFAAYPTSLPDYISRARENALGEAIERYVWAKWWDGLTKATIKNLSLSEIPGPSKKLIEHIHTNTPIEALYEITPCVSNFSEYSTVILFAKLKHGGYLSGGAAGQMHDQIFFRAASEMIRHQLAYIKYKKTPQTLDLFYEQRLIFFAEGTGNSLVEDRLKNYTEICITLPELAFDCHVEHDFDEVVYVHRCLFREQPLFVGGALERLCL